jgi:hypothetical protein
VGGGANCTQTEFLHSAFLSGWQPRRDEEGRYRCSASDAGYCLSHDVYLMIRTGAEYREQGADYFDRLHPERTKNKLTARLERLGFFVSLEPKISPQSS